MSAPSRRRLSAGVDHPGSYRTVANDCGETASPISDSYSEFAYGFYRLMKSRYYRPIGESPKETENRTATNVNETIDASVFHRWRVDASYRPENLTDWANRHGVDMSTLTTSVRADAPTVAVPD